MLQANTSFKSWFILKETTERAGPFGSMPQEPWHSGKGAKADLIALSNSTVGKCTPMQVIKQPENLGNCTTKVILLSDKLWLIAVIKSRSVIKNNLGV